MTISQRIFFLLEKQNKKQNELSKFTGISTSTISAWNKRGTNPPADTLSTIADFFDVSLDYLITGKEYQPNTNNSFNNSTIAYGNNSKVQLNSNNNDEDEIYTELSKIVKSLPLKERSKLITMIYDFQEQYSRNGTANVPHLTTNSPVISQNKQKLLDVFKNFNDYEQVKIIGRIEEWLDEKRKREAINQQPRSEIAIDPQKPWRMTARRTDGVYESRLATPEEVAKLKELLENNPEEPEY